MKYYSMQQMSRTGDLIFEIHEFDSKEELADHVRTSNWTLAARGYFGPKVSEIEPDAKMVQAAGSFPALLVQRKREWVPVLRLSQKTESK